MRQKDLAGSTFFSLTSFCLYCFLSHVRNKSGIMPRSPASRVFIAPGAIPFNVLSMPPQRWLEAKRTHALLAAVEIEQGEEQDSRSVDSVTTIFAGMTVSFLFPA